MDVHSKTLLDILLFSIRLICWYIHCFFCIPLIVLFIFMSIFCLTASFMMCYASGTSFYNYHSRRTNTLKFLLSTLPLFCLPPSTSLLSWMFNHISFRMHVPAAAYILSRFIFKPHTLYSLPHSSISSSGFASIS